MVGVVIPKLIILGGVVWLLAIIVVGSLFRSCQDPSDRIKVICSEHPTIDCYECLHALECPKQVESE